MALGRFVTAALLGVCLALGLFWVAVCIDLVDSNVASADVPTALTAQAGVSAVLVLLPTLFAFGSFVLRSGAMVAGAGLSGLMVALTGLGWLRMEAVDDLTWVSLGAGLALVLVSLALWPSRARPLVKAQWRPLPAGTYVALLLGTFALLGLALFFIGTGIVAGLEMGLVDHHEEDEPGWLSLLILVSIGVACLLPTSVGLRRLSPRRSLQ